MHRNSLLELLDSYRPTHAEDRRARGQMRGFVRAHEDCFERSCVPGHVTSSAWIRDPERECVLLTHHRKLGRWLQLGGHTDGDPDVVASALREAREESGLDAFLRVGTRLFDLDIHPIPARGEEPRHLHYDVRVLLHADSTKPLVISDESHDLAWVPESDLDARGLDESVLRLARKVHGDW